MMQRFDIVVERLAYAARAVRIESSQQHAAQRISQIDSRPRLQIDVSDMRGQHAQRGDKRLHTHRDQ
jgi:hypothetical protein